MNNIDINQTERDRGEDNVRDNEADRYVYGFDASVHEAMPQAIVRPQNTEQVSKDHGLRKQ